MNDLVAGGMKILRVEVRNFGTWNGGAHVFETGGSGAVIAGENGAGKSTIMDALVTLFPMPGSMRFNGAAGKTGKSTRNIRDYYRGAYGNSEDEDGGSRKVTTLRDTGDESQTMAVLMVFGNHKGDVFSVARTLYIVGADLRWRNITGPVDMTIDGDLPGWPSGRELGARASRRGFTVHENQEQYWSAIALGFGLPDAEHAKRAFKTLMDGMAPPDYKSVTELIREHVLPPFDIIAEGEQYFSLLESNGEIQRRIRETRRKADDLGQIVSELDAFEGARARVAEYEADERRLVMIEAYANLLQRRSRLVKARRTETEARAALTGLERERGALLEARIAVEEARRAGGTEAIEGLRRDRARLRGFIASQEEKIGRVLEKAAILGVGQTLDGPEDWERLLAKAAKANAAAQEQAEALDAEAGALNEALGRLRVEAAEKRRRLEAMRRAGTKVNGELVRMRDLLANRIGLPPDEMPFIAELVQVRAEEAGTWEFALNKLLGGQAQRILVHEDHFRNAKRMLHTVPGTGRIVIERVFAADWGPFTGEAVSRTRPESAARKIDVRNDTPFGRYVDRFLARSADHVCVSEEGLADINTRALTPSGVTLSSADRLERDSGRGSSVLGWSIEAAAAALEAEISATETDLRKTQEAREQTEAGRRRLREKQAAAETISADAGPWERMSPQEDKARLAELEARLEVLEAQESESGLADRARQIAQNLEHVDADISALSSRIEAQCRIQDSARGDISRYADKIARLRSDDPVTMTRSDYARNRNVVLRRAKALGWNKNSLNFAEGFDTMNIFDLARKEVKTERGAYERQRDEYRSRVMNAVSAYFRNYGDEVTGPPRENPVHESPYEQERRDAWRAWHRRILDQDLREAEEKMRAVSRASLMQALSDLQLRIVDYQNYVDRLVAGINEAMSRNVYNPATRSIASIKLSSAADPYHADFDAILARAIANAQTKSEAEFYEDAAAVADYVREGDQDINRQRRDRLRNLANRYVAIVRERAIRDGVLKTIRTIEETGKLSGGERERLNFFLLSAALKTAFESKARPEMSLSTFLVDEAFSKSSDDSTAAGIEVIRSFGHQIIIATPMSKILPFEGVAERVFLVSRPTGTNSVVQTILMRKLAEEALRDA